MKRLCSLFSILIALVLCMTVFCACGEDTAPVTHLSKSAREISDAVRAAADFSGATFIANDEPDADLVLMFSYGIDTDEMVGAITDYVLSTATLPDYPAFFSVIRTADGTDPAIITAIAEAVKASYAQYNIDQMVEYNTSGLPVAQAYTVKTYDNGVIITAHGEAGNDDIIALAEDASRAE